ncbi:hypothetical protein Pyn_39665 [Prunus yedoensis var. nudiflora]|uniref:Uncharacterized protein n=1 Tax=Prunus yedoensis var. nudiflora TaxID=2094558 RepID=A0A314YKR3_PRUYE|nr:hypothetical protein Pyn_39665 [Prunus yedoensis var. nudiflora]
MAAGMLAAAKGWRLMAGMTAGMLAAAKGRKEDEFLWFLISLQQSRKVLILPSKYLPTGKARHWKMTISYG